MYFPCLVLPYHRSPARWKTFVSVLTHTIPGAGGGTAGVDAVVALLEAALGLEAGAVAVVFVEGVLLLVECVDFDAVCVRVVTRGVILVIVASGTPAFDSSATEA